MKYMLMIYGNMESWEAMSAETFRTLMTAHAALQDELRATGEFIETNELPAQTSKVVRTTGGVPSVSDGPFVEVKEIFAGYYIVECSGMDRAIEIASKLGEAEFGLVEVREIASQPNHHH